MKGSNTPYSSSRCRKNAQIWLCVPTVEPARCTEESVIEDSRCFQVVRIRDGDKASFTTEISVPQRNPGAATKSRCGLAAAHLLPWWRLGREVSKIIPFFIE